MRCRPSRMISVTVLFEFQVTTVDDMFLPGSVEFGFLLANTVHEVQATALWH